MSSSVRSRSSPAASVKRPPSSSRATSAAIRSASSGRALAVLDVLDLDQPQPGAGQPGRGDRLALEALDRRAAARRTSCADTKRQTSGCIRQVRSRKTPSAGGTVSRSPSRCSSTEAPEPRGWVPWLTWASCCGSPSRTIAAARAGDRERVGERHLARPRRRTARRPRRACSSRAHSHGVPAISCTSSSGGNAPLAAAEVDVRALVVRLRVAAAGLLEPAEVEAGLGRRALDLVEQVGDRLVRGRRDADAPAARAAARRSAARPCRSCRSRAGPG